MNITFKTVSFRGEEHALDGLLFDNQELTADNALLREENSILRQQVTDLRVELAIAKSL